MTEAYPIGTSATAAKYTYYAVDIVSNKILAQIPFEDVVYERTLKGAGTFDGKISINKQTKDLDLYNSTLPGKCALYIVRNGICMWGGIIWGRTYDLFGRSLNVTASEFTSYLRHRIIWKTYSYQFTANLFKSTKKLPANIRLLDTNNVNLKIPVKVLDDYGNLNSVYVSFTRSDLIQYNGYYYLSSSTTPTTKTFDITIPDLPSGTYEDVSISIRVDTYEYLKELMKEAAQDFIDTQFANEVLAPGIKVPYQITNKVATGGIVTLTTSTNHDLVPGQNVEILNVDENVDGIRLVTETPSSNTFRVTVPAYNIKTVSASANTATITVDVAGTNDIFKLKVGSYVTISAVPNFFGYNYFNASHVEILSVSNNNTFTYAITNPVGSASITNTTNTSSYLEYTAANSFSAGQYVTIQKANIGKYNQTNALITYADGAKFRIANPYGPFSGGYVATGATAYIGVPSSSGTPGAVSQISIPSTDIYTNKYEVSTRALKFTKAFGVTAAKRSYNADKTAFIVTLQLSTNNSRTIPFIKGDTISTNLLGDTTKDANKNRMYTPLTSGDGSGVVLTSVDTVKKTVSYELTGVSTKTDSGTYLSEQTTYTTLSNTNTINYANPLTEIELGISEETPLRKDMYVYVAGVDGVSWTQPLYNGFHKITAVSDVNPTTSVINTNISKYETSKGTATLYTSKNNSFVNDNSVTISGFTGSLTFLNGSFTIRDSVQGDLDGESYFTYSIDDNITRSKTSISGVVGKVKGQNIFRYDLPEYGPLGEPNGRFNAVKYKVFGYAKDATDKRSTVRIKTQETLTLNVGDSVNVSIQNTTTDGFYKIQTISASKDSFTYKIPTSKSSKYKDGDDAYKDCSGTVDRYIAQLDQQSLKYSPVISGLSCENNVVTVRSDTHQFSVGDSVDLIFPTAFQDYDNNGYRADIQATDKDTFTYTLNNFRTGVSFAATAGVSQISKYKFTADSNKTSGTIRYTTVNENYYTVGSKVNITKINRLSGSSYTTFQKSIVWSNFYEITAVSDPGATVKWFEVQINGLTNAVTTNEYTLSSPNYGKAVSTSMLISASSVLNSGSASTSQITYSGTGLPFSNNQMLTVVGFTGTNSSRLNDKSKITSASGTTVVVDNPGTTVGSITAGRPFAYVRVYPSAVLDYSQSLTAQTIYGISAVASTKTITLYCPGHGFSDQDLVKLVLIPSSKYSKYYTSDSSPVTITKIDNDTFSYKVSNTISNIPLSETITNITFPTSGTVRFYATNSFSANDKVTIKNVLPAVYNFNAITVTNATGSYFDVSSTETSAYVSSTGVAMTALSPNGTAINAPYVAITPVVFSRSYGEFPNNTDIGGLDFDGTTYSGNFFPNTIVRGSDMVTLDAHMDQYSNTVNGFNYRIDCTLDTSGSQSAFRRKFVLVPITPTTLKEYLATKPNGVLPRGEVAPPYAFGADKITFEHPGNVENVNFSESAENSATRMFISGNNGAGDPNSTARFAGAADNDLLEAGWPILDKAEKTDWPTIYNPLVITVNRDNWGNYDSEADFHKTAQRYLYQSRPPQGDFIIRVNGSLPPVIGSYNPGDWCQLIVDDEAGFINSRLASVLEPRKDVILRRIDNIKVSVPNSPAFPEEIDLTLVTDWEVDRIGK